MPLLMPNEPIGSLGSEPPTKMRKVQSEPSNIAIEESSLSLTTPPPVLSPNHAFSDISNTGRPLYDGEEAMEFKFASSRRSNLDIVSKAVAAAEIDSFMSTQKIKREAIEETSQEKERSVPLPEPEPRSCNISKIFRFVSML